MGEMTKPHCSPVLVYLLLTLTICYAVYAEPAEGQEGQDAVYNGSAVVASPSFIDASMFIKNGQSTTICDSIFYVLTHSYPSNGAVIDARAISGTTALTCAADTTPWSTDGNAHVLTVPSTILLPAGTIVIPTPWVLPNKTRLVGEGDGVPLPFNSPPFYPGTTIQLASGLILFPYMIQFGPSSAVCGSSGCSGISVERLTLDGQAESIDGIVNQLSQNNTYVDHVTIYQILGTGLSISGSASNSGPYSNITFDTGGDSGTSSTVCVQIAANSTKGIHGLHCKSENLTTVRRSELT
jgi:hypothetical protein